MTPDLILVLLLGRCLGGGSDRDAADREHIPVVPVTETLAPAGTTFQAWQARELRHIASALARAGGRQR